jgi:hypothetical protein
LKETSTYKNDLMENKDELTIGLKVTTTNSPKPDAKTYRFSTIGEMFDLMTDENYERLLKEFSMGMEISFHTRKAVHSMANEELKKKGLPEINLIDTMKMPHFDWIDD